MPIGIDELVIAGIGIVGGAVVTYLFLKRDTIVEVYRDGFPQKTLAFLGASGHGKTSLIRYLQEKKVPNQHIETFSETPIGNLVFKFHNLSGIRHVFRGKQVWDINGKDFKVYKKVISNNNPNGIIFIVDASDNKTVSEGVETLKKVCSIYNEVFEKKQSNLEVLFILLNKCDIWGKTSDERKKKEIEYLDLAQDYVDCILDKNQEGQMLVDSCSILKHQVYRELIDSCLSRFITTLYGGTE